MEAIARVFLIDGSSKPVRYDQETTVERVLDVVLQSLGISSLAAPHFALRLQLGPSTHAADRVWLHPHLLLKNITAHLSDTFPASQLPEDLRFDVRIRFVPQSSYELMLTDTKAFLFLHQQVYDDFLSLVAWKVTQEAALELAALHTCRESLERQARNCLDHKLNIESIDVESALNAFVPDTVRLNPSVKPTALRKQFVLLLRKYSSLPHSESVLRSLSILAHIVKYDVEVFKASIGAGWASPVDLIVGAECGLAYRLDDRCKPTHLCQLRNVISIGVRRLEQSTEKTVVQIRLSGSAQPLLITVATRDIADCLAHLLDGYQRMFNQGDSVYKLKGLEHCESVDMRACATRLPPPPPLAALNGEDDIRIKREHVTLKELIGGGQFGNVYKGVLHQAWILPPSSPSNTSPLQDDNVVAVAVKACKSDNEPADTQLILQEAHLMKNFKHDHIVAMIGVCADNPMWLVLELAPLGELRQYLSANKGVLSPSHQVLFCWQLSSAVEYLHSKSFVHRDIAARNALVSTPQCVKLSDFGLSRALDYDAVYTASRGKLPIKWLAPESILYRAFSMASDVWMFGVLIWEVFAWGVKPWQGVPNQEVCARIETGDRPKKMADCPDALYDFLVHHTWAFEAHKRPVMGEIVRILSEIMEQMKRWVRPENVRITRKAQAIPVIRTNIESLPNLTLWRTMEEQRRQAEEDDQWLEEEEHKMNHNTEVDEEEFLDKAFERRMSLASTENGKGSALRRPLPEIRFSGTSSMDSTASTERVGRESPRLPSHSPLSSNNNSVEEGTPERRGAVSVAPSPASAMEALEGVREACYQLRAVYNNNIKQGTFVSLVSEIRNAIVTMNEMCTSEFLTTVDGRMYGQVAKGRLLISNDVELLGKATEALARDDTTKAAFDSYRADIVRLAADLASDADNLLHLLQRSFDSPVERGGHSSFHTILTDC